MGNVFFIRCKPWGKDAADIALRNKIVFFGYALIDRNRYDGSHLRSCLADPSGSQDQWNEGLKREVNSYRQQANRNRNIVGRIQPGDIVILPRPSRGFAYCSYISEKGFELVDNPTWAAEFRSLLPDGENMYHEAEMAQCWHVDGFVAVPIPRLPGWIRRSFFGRSTYGIVPTLDGRDPFPVMSAIMARKHWEPREWTTEIAAAEDRLLTDMAPEPFEHLIVALLQLENPDHVWFHIGGSGDGGVDGISADDSGQVSGLLQCKWQYGNEPILFSDKWGSGETSPRMILASLIHPTTVRKDPKIEFIDRRRVAELTVKHAARLPQAMSMRIGTPPQ